MIVVRGGADSDWHKELENKKENNNENNADVGSEKQFPFECHAFVCDSRQVSK